MSQDSNTESTLINSMQLAMKSAVPDEFEDKNYPFIYMLAHANRHYPQAVLNLHHMKTISSLHESDSKMGRVYSRITMAYEYAMHSCSSIDGKVLNDLLVKKMVVKQGPPELPPQSGGLGLFGGGNKQAPRQF